MDNHTAVSYFLLLEFSKIRHLQILYFFLFLILYLAIATANLLIILAVVFDHRLWSPMYLFLMNLAIQDLGTASVIAPKSMVNYLMNTRHISYFGCVAQVFIYPFFGAADLSLLTVMAYDRYVAICNPLHYEMVMNQKACTEILIVVWVIGLIYATLHTGGTFSIPFCSNIVNQFFCEIPKLLKLSCSGMFLIEIGVLVLSAIAGSGCFTFIVATYAIILKTVWRIPSAKGRQKAFSTCVPHLIIFSMLVITGFSAYLRPPSNSPSYLDLTLSVLYSLLPPLFNPIIYSMRNKNIKTVLSEMWEF